eukprot:m.67746 g.67746  ORF g.67746 m.67746 type:complete len:651 (-) comp23864_c0_seq1:41-1993(-)
MLTSFPPFVLLVLVTMVLESNATVPHLCGDNCGPLFETYPHNDSCWREDTQSYFRFDLQPHYHFSDACFGENDPCAPFYFNGVYHVMWQSHTQYQHIPPWNKAPSGQFGDVGISFGHAVSTDLAHWTQLENALWPDEWFTSVSVYDGSTTIINGVPNIIVAGLTPNSTSVFCHARATPTNLSDPQLVNWKWDTEPLYCGNNTGLRPFDAPTTAWQTSVGQWMYQDGAGGVYVSDDGEKWRGANGSFPHGMVCDFFPLPRVCDGCGSSSASKLINNVNMKPTTATALSLSTLPTHVHEAANLYSLVKYTEGARDQAGNVTVIADGGATVMSAATMGMALRCDHGTYGFPKSFHDPVKNRRLQYGWIQGPGFIGEGDAIWQGMTLKSNHQSLLREVTYDPRFGSLNFFPVEEMALLRGDVMGKITTPTAIPANGVLPLVASQANQSEVRVSFAIPSTPVTFGVRVMTVPDVCKRTPCPARTWSSGGVAFVVAFVPPTPTSNVTDRARVGARARARDRDSERDVGDDGVGDGIIGDVSAYNATVGILDDASRAPGSASRGPLPLLTTEKQIDITIYVDQTVVEVFYAGGRYNIVDHVQPSLFFGNVSNNTLQGVEIIAIGEGVTVLNATVWSMKDAYNNVNTHDRPNRKPDFK